MQFTITSLIAIAVLGLQMASAAPYAPGSSNAAIISQAQEQNTCGNAHLSCCESTDNSVSLTQEEEEGLLHLLGGTSSVLSDGLLGKYSGCSSLASVEGILGAGGGQGLVSGQCNNHVACCDAGDNELVGFLKTRAAVLKPDSKGIQNGLANVAVPCVPVQIL
ncbi:uncharacterized protein BDW70DRAFT_163298 [Aspergillus foveolatus]|uniref:uncharacterized protein n=1 Tax=Aspergillus foveolatus TaxID=210207 RepID=UPI003CCD72F8